MGTGREFFHLVDEPLVFKFGFIVGIPCVIEVIEYLEHSFAVAQGKTAVHAVAVRTVYGCADEVVLKEVFDHVWRIGAQDTIRLEEKEVSGRSELVVYPRVGEESTDGHVVGEGDVGWKLL